MKQGLHCYSNFGPPDSSVLLLAPSIVITCIHSASRAFRKNTNTSVSFLTSEEKLFIQKVADEILTDQCCSPQNWEYQLLLIKAHLWRTCDFIINVNRKINVLAGNLGFTLLHLRVRLWLSPARFQNKQAPVLTEMLTLFLMSKPEEYCGYSIPFDLQLTPCLQQCLS
jgi:hypothetical protein